MMLRMLRNALSALGHADGAQEEPLPELLFRRRRRFSLPGLAPRKRRWSKGQSISTTAGYPR